MKRSIRKMCFNTYYISLLCLSHILCISYLHTSDEHTAIYARIHPTSIKELLLYSSLYPNTPEGKAALQQAWVLLSGTKTQTTPLIPPNFTDNIESFIALVNPSLSLENRTSALSQEALQLIEKIGEELPHKKLRGHSATTIQDLLPLQAEEIDICRAVVLLSDKKIQHLAAVEASLDILALQILARIGHEATWQAKISAINQLLFFELGIRFPPESEAEEKTKNFSDVSSVLFSRRGVCLGASVLYLCLAQRLGLPLSIYTPPGHIFIGYKDDLLVRTIETTARGISIPIEDYYGLTIKYLPERSIKEVIGMVVFNTAAGFLQNKNYSEALSCYEKAALFEDSEELYELTSLCYLLQGNTKKSKEIAQQELAKTRPHLLERDILLYDLSRGTLSPEGAFAIISHTKDDATSVQQEIELLTNLLQTCPASYAIPFHLAHAYLLLGKTREALPILEKVCTHVDFSSSLHALLSSVYRERMNPEASWKEALLAAKLAKAQGMIPKTLQQFIIDLHIENPHSTDVLESMES